ncbi:MAG TPA: DEAD/DEAH box helicase [Actinomycetota bacterium]|nr:DEAD/DEAH box helicase [Actinomycetota bacterium]
MGEEANSVVHMVHGAATEAALSILDRIDLEGRPARYLPVPQDLHPLAQEVLERSVPRGLYRHQAIAVAALLRGDDVALATPTASGKSLAFMAGAAHHLLSLHHSRVLALYPAKALIQDQLNKWQSFLGQLDLSLGFIDGSVEMEERLERLKLSRVILMTPDVAHAWLLRRQDLAEIREFLSLLRLLVLDEAHEYDGVFGTNMAFFLRRLQVAARPHQIICSTATIADPESFLWKLTGRKVHILGPREDGSPSPRKSIMLARSEGGHRFTNILALLREIASSGTGRFLAFADSRKMVERVVAGVHRFGVDEEDERPTPNDVADEVRRRDEVIKVDVDGRRQRVLPYRAGYEEEDRRSIQSALEKGELAGVVSTSALELGLDIGEIDLVVLLSQPPSIKSFWQRLGRAGRRNAGVCLFLDDRGVISEQKEGLEKYLARSLEPSWLYLDNRVIQYANALCAAYEIGQLKNPSLSPFDTLPSGFRKMVDNELNPTEAVPPDLYALKQRGQDTPHLEFPLRSAAEQDFRIIDLRGNALGRVTLAQALREAYPGAVYYYMARPHRVVRLDRSRGEIVCRRARATTTEPIAQVMVFPQFAGGTLQLWRSVESASFVAEVDVQVSERVRGFREIRGSSAIEHRYGVGSEYSQRELTRFFPTSGVCWHYPGMALRTGVAEIVVDAFCSEFGIQARDLGVGLFLSKSGSPFDESECRGFCVYDAAQGSLRLTEMLASHFREVVAAALELTRAVGSDVAADELLIAADKFSDISESRTSLASDFGRQQPDWVPVVARGERAMYVSANRSEEVVVSGYRYTPAGLMYELESANDVTRMIKWETLQPLHGETRMIRYNVMTGEIDDT